MNNTSLNTAPHKRKEPTAAPAKQQFSLFTDFSQIVDQMKDAVLILDTEGCIAWVNQSFITMTGHEHSEILGRKYPHFLNKEFAKDASCQALLQAISSGESFQGELMKTRKDGSHYWVSVVGSPSFGKNGSLEHIICTERDITLSKMKEKAQDELSLSMYDMLLRRENGEGFEI